MKKLTPIVAATCATTLLLTACGQIERTHEEGVIQQELKLLYEDLSQGEKLRLRLLALGDDALISSEEDLQALWDYLNDNPSLGGIDKGLKWQIAENCYLEIIGGRGLLKLKDGDEINYYSFITTIDCPTEITEEFISFISEEGTYTNNNSEIWFFGKKTEL